MRSAMRSTSRVNETAQAFQFALARRIMAQKFIGQSHCAQRKAHGVADVPTPRNGEFTTSAAEIDHQNVGDARGEGWKPGPGE